MAMPTIKGDGWRIEIAVNQKEANKFVCEYPGCGIVYFNPNIFALHMEAHGLPEFSNTLLQHPVNWRKNLVLQSVQFEHELLSNLFPDSGALKPPLAHLLEANPIISHDFGIDLSCNTENLNLLLEPSSCDRVQCMIVFYLNSISVCCRRNGRNEVSEEIRGLAEVWNLEKWSAKEVERKKQVTKLRDWLQLGQQRADLMDKQAWIEKRAEYIYSKWEQSNEGATLHGTHSQEANQNVHAEVVLVGGKEDDNSIMPVEPIGEDVKDGSSQHHPDRHFITHKNLPEDTVDTEQTTSPVHQGIQQNATEGKSLGFEVADEQSALPDKPPMLDMLAAQVEEADLLWKQKKEALGEDDEIMLLEPIDAELQDRSSQPQLDISTHEKLPEGTIDTKQNTTHVEQLIQHNATEGKSLGSEVADEQPALPDKPPMLDMPAAQVEEAHPLWEHKEEVVGEGEDDEIMLLEPIDAELQDRSSQPQLHTHLSTHEKLPIDTEQNTSHVEQIIQHNTTEGNTLGYEVADEQPALPGKSPILKTLAVQVEEANSLWEHKEEVLGEEDDEIMVIEPIDEKVQDRTSQRQLDMHLNSHEKLLEETIDMERNISSVQQMIQHNAAEDKSLVFEAANEEPTLPDKFPMLQMLATQVESLNEESPVVEAEAEKLIADIDLDRVEVRECNDEAFPVVNEITGPGSLIFPEGAHRTFKIGARRRKMIENMLSILRASLSYGTRYLYMNARRRRRLILKQNKKLKKKERKVNRKGDV